MKAKGALHINESSFLFISEIKNQQFLVPFHFQILQASIKVNQDFFT